ncbi:DUF2789 domain-containing protein [Pusillimonas sp. CC-YST705]|uniref:DUF2789 domain-containing protein n=1 Tax=Mesopusillimonas faecipullorum TaxID=2755040 RepID=A0ABS8CFB0_9BURK|nr:DUF2789 domain-containing protein [Mesopusillimonas faecipullorum]MCB5364722.1 DUF2789 domain-containing protein [Mesopusillimonas faecipullorum]
MNTIPTIPTMSTLFLQLGLDADDKSIAEFIGKHQLPTDVRISEAPYWNEGQRQFIAEKLAIDGEWTTIIDQLNESLHEDAVKRSLEE